MRSPYPGIPPIPQGFHFTGGQGNEPRDMIAGQKLGGAAARLSSKDYKLNSTTERSRRILAILLDISDQSEKSRFETSVLILFKYKLLGLLVL